MASNILGSKDDQGRGRTFPFTRGWVTPSSSASFPFFRLLESFDCEFLAANNLTGCPWITPETKHSQWILGMRQTSSHIHLEHSEITIFRPASLNDSLKSIWIQCLDQQKAEICCQMYLSFLKTIASCSFYWILYLAPTPASTCSMETMSEMVFTYNTESFPLKSTSVSLACVTYISCYSFQRNNK